MDAALGWIGGIVEWLGQWIPRWVIVRSTERAIKFRWGKYVVELLPGIRFYWPAVTDIEGPIPVVWQPMVTSSVPLQTKDGKQVTTRGVIVYKIVDAIKFLVDHYDSDSCIDDEVNAAIRDVVTTKDLLEIQENSRKTTDNALHKQVQKSLDEFGIEVKHVRLVAFAEAKILNVVGDSFAAPTIAEVDE